MTIWPLVLALGPGATEPPDEVPGGYWEPGEIESEPRDGHEHVVTGSILLSLGSLALVSSGVTAYFTAPAHCQERLADLAPSDEQCRSLFAVNVANASLGGLMVISGAVLLGIGLHRRKHHREWKRRRGLSLSPMHVLRGAGATLSLRF
jgi:hypothetical protein